MNNVFSQQIKTFYLTKTIINVKYKSMYINIAYANYETTNNVIYNKIDQYFLNRSATWFIDK